MLASRVANSGVATRQNTTRCMSGTANRSLCVSGTASRARCVSVRADGGNGAADGLPVGAKVRVKTEVRVFHAPKKADGLDLQGKEGVIAANTIYYKDKVLSPNLPYKVQFALDYEGAPKKFFVHLEEDELEVLA